jgi:Hydrogenase formation hypA family
VPEVYGKPIVVAGFEPLDILQSVYMLLAQLREGRCEAENQYSRVVRDEGNPAAIALLAQVFELRPHFEWRGLGFISQSALKLNSAYAEFDAELRYSMPALRVADPKACQCGEVLKGVIKPWECKVFGTAGQRLFARYAYGPNHLGYCGPADSAALLELATTGRTTEDVESIAARFSGAWPYLCVLAELAGVDDPLDERVVRAYWQLRRWTDWQLVVTNTRLAR